MKLGKTNIAVSVVVPIYNAEKYLEKCLDSIEQQTMRNIEVILIDDGSKDDSASICQRFCEKDARFTYYRKENEGLAAARQDGMDRANGEYVGFVDSDDWLELNMYERMYSSAKKENADIVFCNCFVDEHIENPIDLEPGVYDKDDIEKKILSRSVAGITAKGANSVIRWSNCLRIYRLDMIRDNNISFDRRFRRSQDLPFTFETTLCSSRYISLNDEFLYHNRSDNNGDSLSRGYTKDYWNLINPLIKKLYDDIEKYNRSELVEQMHLSTFFFANQGIINECKKSTKSLMEKICKLKEILDDVYVQEALPHIKKRMLNSYYQGVYDCLTRNTAIGGYFTYMFHPFKVKMKEFPIVVLRKVINNRFVEPQYIWLRKKLNKKYVAKK